MQHFKGLPEKHLGDSWLTIGSFDGVHIGHQQLIRDLVEGAHSTGMKAGVLTFYPHPAEVLRGLPELFYLTTPEEKAEYLENLGVDYVITIPFDQQLASLTASEFMRYIGRAIAIRRLLVGKGFALGKGRTGTVDVLATIGIEVGYQLQEIEPFTSNGEVVSSSLIRSLLSEGNIPDANAMLGRQYSVSGEIHHGDGRGHTIGFPTANVSLPAKRLLPKSGVYVCQVGWSDKTRSAVCNIGIRPTFETGDTRPILEVHILDFTEDLYNQSIRVRFIERLRDEKKFSSVQELIQQIEADIRQTREILS